MVLGIEFSPLNVPLSRRLQTFAVCCAVFIGFIGHALGIIAFLILFLSRFWLVAVFYACWMIVDHDSSSRGGRRINFIRKLRVWQHLRDYFPVELVKTADLDPRRNYIMGYHPHGVIGAGAYVNFGTEANNFSELFPGITPNLLVLKLLFKFPFYREMMMALGICDVSKESIIHLCSKNQGGNAVIIVVGGAAESLNAHPGAATLTLKDRKGFVKMALVTGSALVPVYSFGENDLFSQVDNPKGSWLRSFQIRFMKIVSFAPVLFHGRGIFQYNFGLLPYRRHVTTIVGAPIPVYKRANPTMEDIDRLHKKYIERLQMLFDKYKGKYAPDHPNATLTIE
eukprot:Seg1554.2 transcript_id=Seg1554.2/GoldUCD/mRNA.D3Y31 product="2-acylglycerol O-acyltransferase 2-A" protein_id=Seg1554.2/GoldUCD/D3Y31